MFTGKNLKNDAKEVSCTDLIKKMPDDAMG